MIIRKKVSVFWFVVLIFLAGIHSKRDVAVGGQTQSQNLVETETVLSKDATQSLYVDEADVASISDSWTGQSERMPTFSLYCIGSEFQAESGDGTAACDVRNKPDSTHDILMHWYITEKELALHNLSTEGLETIDDSEERRWTIAETGLFEPGYHITSVQLSELPDGTSLPAGSYNLILSENYYDHITGKEFPYTSTIPITLTIG